MRMKHLLFVLPLLVLPSMTQAQSGSASDQKAIREVESRWEKAWNEGDVAAMTRDFATDADAVNLAGEWFKGRAPFAQSIEELHADKAKGSVWQTEQTSVKFLTPEIAIVHVLTNSHGEHNPDGSLRPPRRAILTRVEVKRDGKWLIVASQATSIVPRASAALTDAARQNAGQ
ncbi:MAG TPA: SgcJ/EcaC family oxidoreductase [Candidatus Acidoferrales bacterium]|nr:SgcJ/EcaC family oxidoreductase [Candidatus Acidoferrales bacterium]